MVALYITKSMQINTEIKIMLENVGELSCRSSLEQQR